MFNALSPPVMGPLGGQSVMPQLGLVGSPRPQPRDDLAGYINALDFRHEGTPMGPDNMTHGSGINPRTRTVWDRISGRFGGTGGGHVPGVPGLPTAPGVPARTNGGYGFTPPANMIGSTYNIPGVSAPTNPYQLPTYTPGG